MHLRAHACTKPLMWWGCVEVLNTEENSYLHPAPEINRDLKIYIYIFNHSLSWDGVWVAVRETIWLRNDTESPSETCRPQEYPGSASSLDHFLCAEQRKRRNNSTVRRVARSPRRFRVLPYFHFFSRWKNQVFSSSNISKLNSCAEILRVKEKQSALNEQFFPHSRRELTVIWRVSSRWLIFEETAQERWKARGVSAQTLDQSRESGGVATARRWVARWFLKRVKIHCHDK